MERSPRTKHGGVSHSMMRVDRLLLIASLVVTAGCGESSSGVGEALRVRVPPGAAFAQVADSLAAKDIIGSPRLFRLYARVSGQARQIKPGTYEFRPESGWRHVLDELVAGNIVTERLVIPEGLRLDEIAGRIAALTEIDGDSLAAALLDTTLVTEYDVPGPTLEGYLYPATYSFPVDAEADDVIEHLIDTYRRVWTDERRRVADSIGMTERQVVTLASIIEKEAVLPDEMPIISAVYHNRLRIGMPLQADPTVQYALGGHRERLLYADIDRVADHPYNTYTQPGLPPGPIASPAERAIDAALSPADVDFLYFVARPDGSHVFSRTLAEHNRARVEIRRQQQEQQSGS
jgi:UPF0755 protein